jgi:molybdopterin synthase catalytic subunit
MSVNITDKSFLPEALHAQFRDKLGGDCGAIIAFTGVVRSALPDNEFESLTLLHYAGFTERQIEATGQEAMRRWPINAWHVTHRVGTMAAKEPIVFVATASQHRRAAFEAADFLMDYLKSEAPFWKSERHKSGQRWIEPRAQDLSDKSRWQDETGE